MYTYKRQGFLGRLEGILRSMRASKCLRLDHVGRDLRVQACIYRASEDGRIEMLFYSGGHTPNVYINLEAAQSEENNRCKSLPCHVKESNLTRGDFRAR